MVLISAGWRKNVNKQQTPKRNLRNSKYRPIGVVQNNSSVCSNLLTARPEAIERSKNVLTINSWHLDGFHVKKTLVYIFRIILYQNNCLNCFYNIFMVIFIYSIKRPREWFFVHWTLYGRQAVDDAC